ncbi:MAG: Hint domain-containing protein [Paracoccus sp. (in: a-proteobacteria)]|nr:Hint domain-containing protein [Paracoccus sp. (in: a-proteobacteria)]
MEHQILLLTFPTPIPADSGSYYPFHNMISQFTIADARQDIVYLYDEEERFRPFFYGTPTDQQYLTRPLTVGQGASEETLPAGTQLTNFLGSILRDDAGNRFVVMFPRIYTDASFGPGPGGLHSVMVFPLPVADGQGNLVFPMFDVASGFSFVRTYNPEADGNNDLRYPPTAQSEPVHPQIPPACLTTDTLVMTDRGPCPVQTLAAGDRVLTRDDGLQPILWRGMRHHDPAQLDLMPQHRPVRIARGALGSDGAGRPCPDRDLVVSPQHRILLASRIVARMLATSEILVPARRLAGLPGISIHLAPRGVTYWHLLLARHQVILTENAWTETLLPASAAMQAFGPAARKHITALAPKFVAEPEPARPIPAGHVQRRLVQRHAGNPARHLYERARQTLDA